MRIAILSDIHANIEALRAVLADVDRQGVDEVVSLGDNVGYGPNPEEVVRLLEERGVPSVMGNHEEGLADEAKMRWFNPVSREALLCTRCLMSQEALARTRGLPRFMLAHGARLVHGMPPDDVRKYLIHCDESELAGIMRAMPERLCFVGHTHQLALVRYAHGQIERRRLPDNAALPREGKLIVNAGSVGQPRDGDPHAKYLIWDPGADTVEVRRVDYDVEAVVAKLLRMGMPGALVARLRGEI